MTALSDPGLVVGRLESIELELALLQNEYETAAMEWFRAKRAKEKQWAVAFISAQGTVAERKAIADRDTAEIGMEEEASYEAKRAAERVLSTRASIGQSILRSQGRA